MNSQIAELDRDLLLKLVVLGNSEVGKTSFIRHALDLKKTTTAPIFTGRVSLHGIVYRVQLTELDLEDVEIEDGRHVSWPKYVGDLPFSSPDAVICLYDITDSDSIQGVPQFLFALANLDTTVQLVASKTDAPESDHELDSTFTDRVRQKFPHVLIAESSHKSAEYAKRCMLMVMKAVLNLQSSREPPVVKSPVSRTTRPNEFHKSRDSTTLGSSDHAQTSSLKFTDQSEAAAEAELSMSEEESDTDSDQDIAATERTKALMRLQTKDLQGNSRAPQGPQTPVSETEISSSQAGSAQVMAGIPETPESYINSTAIRPGTSGTADSRAHQTFFNYDDESPTESESQEEFLRNNLNIKDSPRVEGGISFSDLVDRLLQLPVSKNDLKFAPAFLCLYRSFATPTRLIAAIIDRFVTIEASNAQQMVKVGELLRYLQVMAQWTSLYPGDFAGVTIRELALTFVQNVEQVKNFSHAATEIKNNLQIIIPDEDADWAFSDSARSNHSRTESAKIALSEARASQDDSDDSEEGDDAVNRSSPRYSGTASTASSLLKFSMPSSQSATNLAALENAREQARKLKSIPHIGLSKIQWRFFMEIPTDDLARELTRIDWTMYSAIRPRDFVRHVTMPRQRSQADNIGAMIKRFNHLALFVAAMVLLRDKPKHRAKVLEKFMDLAWKVRQLNNYNSLAALVAGITSAEVIRLGQTHELVPAEVKKQFLRLTVLMSNAKSYATYRMAWENSTKERIPFISSVLRDLTLAAGANQTFIGTHVNWKKFEIMGESIVSIQRSYEHPYTFPDKTQRIQDINRLFLETKVTNEPEVRI